MLMAQQQQQQQRQLHELLLQLLAVHKLGTGDNISPPLTVGEHESPLLTKRRGMCTFSVFDQLFFNNIQLTKTALNDATPVSIVVLLWITACTVVQAVV